MPPLTVMLKPASGLCNMSCEYCFYKDEMQKRAHGSYGFMSVDTLKNVIRRTMLPAEHAISYIYQGGEPTLRGINFYKKAIEFQRQYNKKKIFVQNSIQTNGLLLDDQWCKFLKTHDFLVGLSIDGIEETHDAFRKTKAGVSTYISILAASQLLERYKVNYNIVTVVNRGVAESIEDIYYNYQKNGWRYQQYIACLNPLGEGAVQKTYSLTPKIYGNFLIRLFQLWYADWEKGRQPYIRQFENYVMLLLGYQAEACDQNGRCGIQQVVEADGSVFPCDFYMLDAYKLGNFNVNLLSEIEKRREEIQFIKKSEDIDPECKNCQYFKLCRGGCQRQREQVGGNDHYENILCEGFKMFFEICSEKLQVIAKSILILNVHNK